MESDQPTRARPISMATRREGVMSPGRPTLEEVLNNTAPSPYTLAAYTAFLSQQHCLETLEFVTESRKYSTKYEEAAASSKESKVMAASDEGDELMMDWSRLLDVYVKPGAPREINLPAEERDDLIRYPFEPTLPPPQALDPAIKRMYDLMSDSIFIPFCNSLKAPSHAQTYTAVSELAGMMHEMDSSRTYEDRAAMHRRMQSKGRRSPPTTSPSNFEASRSPTEHRPTHTSSLSSAIHKQQANRLSTLVSNQSAASESALTDDSGGGAGETPPAGEAESVTPPTTPPNSDLGTGPATHGIKPQRSESGGWSRKMGKLFGANKKRSSFLE